MKKRSLIKYLKNPYRFFVLLSWKGKLKFIPDKQYLSLLYRGYTGKRLNIKQPKTYNEKIQWLKIYDRNPDYIPMVDKYEVRKYISREIGEKYLIPLLGVYDKPEDISFENLPNKFVLKCTHDSGSVLICKDKSAFDKEKAKKKLNEWLNRNYFYTSREWPYKSLKPRIICEQFLQDDIIDYKIMCFGGEPKLIQVHRNRNQSDHSIDFYDTNWKKTNIKRKDNPTGDILKKPSNLSEMLNISRILSKGEIHVRIDLYEVNGEIFFGEKTYYSASGFAGFEKDEHDELLGSWIKLS